MRVWARFNGPCFKEVTKPQGEDQYLYQMLTLFAASDNWLKAHRLQKKKRKKTFLKKQNSVWICYLKIM